MPGEDLEKLAVKLATDGPVRTHPTPRLIRLLVDGQYIVRTTAATFVWEQPYYPWLYLPSKALSDSSPLYKLSKTKPIHDASGREIAAQLTLTIGTRTIDRILQFAPDLTGPGAPLAGLIKVEFGAVDRWFEEDQALMVHPKDPFKRIEALSSTRPIRVRVGGRVVAHAATAVHLHETGLPVRYYLPFTAVDATVLRPSDTRTLCPYKGEAEYYSVEVDGKLYKDIVWFYRAPLAESVKIEGLLSFYNEKVEIELEDEVLKQPVTHFSKSPNTAPSALDS